MDGFDGRSSDLPAFLRSAGCHLSVLLHGILSFSSQQESFTARTSTQMEQEIGQNHSERRLEEIVPPGPSVCDKKTLVRHGCCSMFFGSGGFWEAPSHLGDS